MSLPIERLTVTAQALLDACVTILGTTKGGIPESQFLTSGRPAFDCEFVAVQVALLREDTTQPLSILETKKRNRFGNIILATFVIYVVRCGPTPKPGQRTSPIPSDEDKTENAALVYEDGWALWNGIRDVQDDLFDACLGVYFDGGTPIAEQGGFVGWQFQIRASIDGYDP